jgi:hypothetical protein
LTCAQRGAVGFAVVSRNISDTMHSKEPPRNRLAKVLPEQWRKQLIDLGVPKRKYTAVLKVTLDDGTIIDDVIIEQGWIISTRREHLGGVFEYRIPFDPRTISEIELIQFV